MRNQGMTLLELMLSMGMLVVVMACAFPLIDNMITRFQMTRDHYIATSLCQARLERARGLPFENLAMLEERDEQIDDQGNPSAPGGRFQRSTTILSNTPEQGLTQITVTVRPCICSRWGWRRIYHPLSTAPFVCKFTEEKEELVYVFTEYKK